MRQTVFYINVLKVNMISIAKENTTENEDTKYIFVLPNIRMAAQLTLPPVPCLVATVSYQGEEVPEVMFYSEEVKQHGDPKFLCPDAG